MTNMPEAKLAREAELCYATVALVTDYDVWHPEHDAVTVEAVIANLVKNVATAKDVLRRAIPRVTARACRSAAAARRSLRRLITDPRAIPPAHPASASTSSSAAIFPPAGGGRRG